MSAVDAIPLLAAAGGDYQISRSVRLRSSASGNFSRTVGTPTNKDVWTISSWTKYSAGGKVFPLFSALSGGYYEFLEINAGGDFYWITRNSAGSIFKQYYAATGQRLFRDPSAWYHFVVRKTSALTLQFYVNGEEFTLTAQTVGSPSSSINTAATTHYLGYQAFNAEYADGYLTEVNFIDGQALTPSSFGETDSVTGVWKPKKYAGTYGTNGFYLNFSDNSAATATTIGKDYSGNGNNWTPNNISVTAGVTCDSMIDVPTVSAAGSNFAVFNPLSDSGALTSANLNFDGTYTQFRRGTIGISGGDKTYIEITYTRNSGNGGGAGFCNSSFISSAGALPSDGANAWGFHWDYVGGTSVYGTNGSTTAGPVPSTTQTLMIAIDGPSNKAWLGIDGTWVGSGNPSTGANPTFTNLSGMYPLFPVAKGISAGSVTATICSGQAPFSASATYSSSAGGYFRYTPPTGFKALNTQNLPEATIKKGNQYFDANIWTGTGATQSITNGGFQPDLVWVKSRSAAANPNIVDAVRGLGNTLFSNTTDAETFISNQVTALNSNGFTLGADTNGGTNFSGRTFVGWQWKESASAGFDIVTYTGNGANRTIAHSLGVAPSMIIVKRRDAAGYSWIVGLTSLGWANFLVLNATTASQAASTVWNNTAPTSSVFSLGSDTFLNASAGTYVAYCFSEVAGYSKFGSYVGNGSADGPFVYCGFRPKFVLVKCSSNPGEWYMLDTSRSQYNVANGYLIANQSSAEATGAILHDFLSNGFKVRDTVGAWNTSGYTYIYAAFAENPFKNSLAR